MGEKVLLIKSDAYDEYNSELSITEYDSVFEFMNNQNESFFNIDLIKDLLKTKKFKKQILELLADCEQITQQDIRDLCAERGLMTASEAKMAIPDDYESCQMQLVDKYGYDRKDNVKKLLSGIQIYEWARIAKGESSLVFPIDLNKLPKTYKDKLKKEKDKIAEKEKIKKAKAKERSEKKKERELKKALEVVKNAGIEV